MADPILRSNFKTVPFEEILGVLSLSRQAVGVHFSDEDQEVGVIAVKAGQVIGAEDFRARTNGTDALKGLVRDPGTAFAVVALPREAPETHGVTSIGKLGELLSARGDGHTSDSPGPSTSGAELQGGEVIMRGEIGDVGFDEILEVLPLSQMHVLVLFIRDGAQVGTLNLMSGEVLAATAGSLRGIAAFNQLLADHGEMFEVRRLEVPGEAESLGSVAKLLADARAAPPAPSTPLRTGLRRERTLFMQGTFSDFPLAVLINSLELCRQALELEMHRGDQILHRVLIKGGRITAVVSAFVKGADAALAAIHADPGDEFYVFRRQGLAVGESLAAVRALISETDSIPGSTETHPALPDGAHGTPAAVARDGAELNWPDLSGIEKQLEQLAGDVAALRSRMKTPPQDAGRARLTEVLSRVAAVHTKLQHTLEQTPTEATKELRIALRRLGSGRRERALLWSVLAVQIGTVAAVVGLVVLLG